LVSRSDTRDDRGAVTPPATPLAQPPKTRRLFCPTSQARRVKIFLFPKDGNYDLKKPSRPTTEGRSANRHDTLGGMRWTLPARRRCAPKADGQAVWSCPLDAGVKLIEMIDQRRWLSSPIHRGEHGAAEKNHRAGNAGSCRRTLGDYARVLSTFFAREAAGAPAPGIPCALLFSRDTDFRKARVQSAPRECGVVSSNSVAIPGRERSERAMVRNCAPESP
jgi:hypothetical protein